jgi:anti-sigma regulatory factor (Ser/Thr protein kinase)
MPLHRSPGQPDSSSARDAGHILSLAFDLPEAVQYIAHLRRTALCFLEGMGVSRDDSSDVELLLGELATNAARHARGGGYHVDLDFYESKAVITVTDNGVGFIKEHLPPPGVRPPDTFDPDAAERYGGFGLPLVHSIADKVEIQPNVPHGTVVRAEKRFR